MAITFFSPSLCPMPGSEAASSERAERMGGALFDYGGAKKLFTGMYPSLGVKKLLFLGFVLEDQHQKIVARPFFNQVQVYWYDLVTLSSFQMAFHTVGELEAWIPLRRDILERRRSVWTRVQAKWGKCRLQFEADTARVVELRTNDAGFLRHLVDGLQ